MNLILNLIGQWVKDVVHLISPLNVGRFTQLNRWLNNIEQV